jgi:hypothetical protein
MLKLLAFASLLFAFTFGMTAMAVAQTIAPPSSPSIRYVPWVATQTIASGKAAPFIGWWLPAVFILEPTNGAIRAASRKIRERATDFIPA